MQLVIDQSDFQKLSPDIQAALVEALAGDSPVAQRHSGFHGLRWRQPIDLKPDQAARFVHGLSEGHRRRLALFARKDGRVRMREMQAVFGDSDLRAASEFQKAMTRRLRRLFEDPEKKAQLIGWDFDATKWDEKRTTIVDGVYFVSEPTAKALKNCLKTEAMTSR